MAGDWDLSVEPVPTDAPIVEPKSTRKAYGVVVGRNGDLILAEGNENVSSHPSNVYVPIRVVGRHREWLTYRESLENYVADDGGVAYAPINHPDLAHIRHWNGHRRLDVILKHLQPGIKRVLDIGAHMGYMCDYLEEYGYECTAVENDPAVFLHLSKLRQANRRKYLAVNEDICVHEAALDDDCAVLALAVFHHFLKRRSTYEALLALLPKLAARQMIIWCHNPREQQMANAYKNLLPNDFIRMILDHAPFRSAEVIGSINYRPLISFQ